MPKAKRDPNVPKKPLTAYFFFSNHERPKVKADHPGIQFADTSREIGRRWALMDERDKARFKQMADDDKERYEEEINNHRQQEKAKLVSGNVAAGPAPAAVHLPMVPVPLPVLARNHVPTSSMGGLLAAGPSFPTVPVSSTSGGVHFSHGAAAAVAAAAAAGVPIPGCSAVSFPNPMALPSASKPKKLKKDPNRIKRPTTAFFFFSGQKRPEVRAARPDLSTPEVSKALGEMWRAMSDDDKRPFVDLANADRQRYEEQSNDRMMQQQHGDAQAAAAAAAAASHRDNNNNDAVMAASHLRAAAGDVAP